MKRTFLAGLCLGLFMLGCDRTPFAEVMPSSSPEPSASVPQPSVSPEPKPVEPSPSPSEPPSQVSRDACASENVKRVSRLIDQEAYRAAEGVLNKLLRDHPDDAKLHIEYVRWIILSTSMPNSGYIVTPISTDDQRYSAASVANEAALRAMQLEPDCKTRFANVIFETLQARIDEHLKNEEGIIGVPRNFYNAQPDRITTETGFATSMIQIGWIALEASPDAATSHISAYRSLMDKAIRSGQITSAAMLGNLLGDIEQGGVKKGNLDFEYACDAFERSLSYYSPPSDNSVDWVAYTVETLQWLFPERIKQAAEQETRSFRQLEAKLQSRGYSLLKGRSSKYGLPNEPKGSGAPS